MVGLSVSRWIGRRLIFSRNPSATIINRDGCIHWRFLSSSSSGGPGDGDNNDTPISPSTSTNTTNAKNDENISKKHRRKGPKIPETKIDPIEAKAKLNLLLQSIIKDQEANKLKQSDDAGDDEKYSRVSFKLAKPITEKPPPPTEEQIRALKETKATEKEIGKELFSAVKEVAKVGSNSEQEKIIENELVQKLKSHSVNKINLNELVEGMKVAKSKEKPPSVSEQMEMNEQHSRARRVKRDMGVDDKSHLGRRRGRSNEDISGLSYKPINIFGSPPLGIFTNTKSDKPNPNAPPISYLKTWDALHQKDLNLAVTHPPANGFEEMIMWTEQGKFWQFPIDNEQGLDEEAKVSFTDHVFLEPQIDHWCPKKGPIRQFMELVCIGLGKNPYLTVQEKRDHLGWYHEYFKNKGSIIKDVGAGEIK